MGDALLHRQQARSVETGGSFPLQGGEALGVATAH
jgi:hypothetical protein